ncbi:MAG: SDR family NAD(P)-dependent oxidoreductase, partial [Moorea sp. SIO2B7]|nr:SDR family NAD(P)-dependent oxidoreductase [Moorena sp. SIO2B7]
LEDIVGAVDFIRKHRLGGIYNLVNDFNFTSREFFDKVCEQQGLAKVSWDASKPSYRSLNARINNQKIKTAGYRLIHPHTIV